MGREWQREADEKEDSMDRAQKPALKGKSSSPKQPLTLPP